ncbi:MAG: 1-(5-phosphoribosyl)-5-[(5-phosphoribosylamino)methylideneamino]imidazole-4-carboxamide isomerase [Planctomycetota bacterium]|nr:1-(5-phosphoribosyl)-5-[(5-phosphoribosylamino)methylideneamino]imidazole-4-carboxamide isomerase [Planctomycetota bacterium]
MLIWPAIDLLDGKCVRLQQGDYQRNTIFSDSPGETAAKWFAQGASCLHCVDLDGAKSGSIINADAIRQIVAAAGQLPVQLGGGVRNEATIERLLGLGLSRLVVGTAALKDPAWFAAMCERYVGHLVLGLDARNGLVATEGWLETSSTLATDLIKRIADQTEDCVAVVYTDIAKDGMMAGPNFEALKAMQDASPFPVVASGGVTTLQDIDDLVTMKTDSCIIGRTLYEGHISLKDALEHASAK